MQNYATVILTIPNEDGFSYRIPEELQDSLQPGMLVSVPFGKRFVPGIVIGIGGELPPGLDSGAVKPISDIIFDQPVVSGEMQVLLKWISDYYVCHLGEAYRLIQPSLNVGSSQMTIRRLPLETTSKLTDTQRKILENIPAGSTVSVENLRKKVKLISLNVNLHQMEKLGLLERCYSEIKKKKILQTVDYFRLCPGENRPEQIESYYQKVVGGRNTQTRSLVEYLSGKNWTAYSELNENGFNRAVVNRLVKNGLLEKDSREKLRNFELPYNEPLAKIVITDGQRKFLEAVSGHLDKAVFKIWLLHGITGSGKTQVYIELIKRVIQLGKQAIVLIPEIVLTPQTLTRFRHYFGDRVGVIHSRLSAGEKREILHRARQDEFDVVIGPRSAIFAPLNRLGLVVVDEEHEASYKQADAQPRYHARDVAIYRAYLNRATVVLGSATPSFESLYNARQGNYEYFRLMKRIEARALPRISIVDLRKEWNKNGERPLIAENLELKIESRLLIREQVMILQNRRGYAPYILCKDCGYVAKCPNCDITLTFHQRQRQLICHYCGFQQPAPDVCPDCESMEILYKGVGTQRMEEVLLDKFSHARTLRMDQDTTRGKNGHLEILEKFRNGSADILLGTKMIAKGLDFRKVSLVGIVSADQGLHFPDFRASEKVFQLLTQAAGRAGRGENSGEVVVQTFDPSHPMFKFLLSHNYTAFYEQELKSRQALKYPPFSRLMLIRIEGKNLKQVEQYSETVRKFLWKANEEKRFSVLGPSPAPIARIQQIYRYHILVKQEKESDASMGMVRRLVKEGLYKNPAVRKWPVKVAIDMDPVEIL